jgi:multiple sugar transport system substrate-binding protein
LVGLAALLAAAASGSRSQAGKFDGVTVNLVTFTGPQIAEPLQRRAPDFEKLTGAKINVTTVPFSDLYTKLLTDWSAAPTRSMPLSLRRNGWSTTWRADSSRTHRPDRQGQGHPGE